MTTSPTISKIAPAYLNAQKQTGAAIKESTNPFYHSNYADLGSVMEACKKALNDNGISVLQPTRGDVVETILLHESGEWLAGETKIVMKEESNPQSQGSAISYARRYGLQSMVFIPAEDDDGEKATDRSPKQMKVSDPIMEVTADVPNTSVCPECHATGRFHKPGCSYAK